MNLWIDSHCHIQPQYVDKFDRVDPVDQLVKDAQDSGVVGMVCVGTDAESSRQAMALAGGFRQTDRRSLDAEDADPSVDVDVDVDVWATVGLHPHEASHGVAEIESVLLDALARFPERLVGVGECGLDYHYDHSPRSEQRDVFARQIAMSKLYDLALVVHTRSAWDDTLDILRNEGAPERTVIHCFTGGPDEARACLDLGAYLSFSGIVTFKAAPEVRDAAVLCPEERLMVETDAPFLAPVPHRGEPNRPAWVGVVGEALAAIRGAGVEETACQTRRATLEAFGLKRLSG